MKRDRKVIIEKIIAYCDEVVNFTRGMSNEEFIDDLKTLRAVTMCLIQVGELVYVLDRQVKNENPHVDWNGIAGLRHRLVHDYEGINYNLLWHVVSHEVGKLKKDLMIIC